jgi:hypothetical protein
MRLDNVSYATSHDQLADTVKRLCARLGSTYVDGGVHPRFGTRNFTMPLQYGKYIEVVCSLHHPSKDVKAVAAIEKITIADSDHLTDSWFKTEISDGLNGADIEFIDPSTNDGEYGIVAVRLMTPSGTVKLD